MQMKINKNGVKLLAIATILVMAFAGFIVISDNADAEESGDTTYFKIGNTTYAGITDALKAVQAGETILMTGDYTGPGIGLFNSKSEQYSEVRSFTIDLGGFTYDIVGPAVGSSGTETQAVHIEDQYTITLKNGIIACSDPVKAKTLMLVQNYCDLTLENITLDGSKLGAGKYTMSNNCGDILLKGETNIIASEGGVAFDLYYWPSGGYADGVRLTFDSTYSGTVSGKIELTVDKDSNKASALEKNALTISKNAVVTLNGDIDDVIDLPITLDGKLIIGSNCNVDAIFTNTVEETTNTVDMDITTGTNGLTLSVGSIIIDGEFVTTSGNAITVTDGTAKLIADIPTGMNVVINGDATLEIPANKNIENNGAIVNNGSLVISGTIVNNEGSSITNNDNGAEIIITGTYTGVKITNTKGTVEIPAGSVASDIVKTGGAGVISTSTASGESFGMKDTLESDYTVVTSAFLANKLVIPAGITLTVKGILDLQGNELVVEGKLVIESKGSVVGDILSASDSKITISKDGVIENNGLIGNNSFVTVQDKQTSAASVVMKNVTGVEFGLTKVVGNSSVDYILTVSGEAVKKGDSPALQINNAYIDTLTIKDLSTGVVLKAVTVIKNGTLTIDTKAAVSIIKDDAKNAVTLNNGAVLVVDGKITSADVTNDNTTDVIYMKNGSTVIVNGNIDLTKTNSNTYTHKVVIGSKAGSFKTYSGDAKVDAESATEIASSFSTIELTDVTGITVEVTSRAYTDNTTSMTEQMLNIYGTVSFTKKADNTYNTAGEITIDGNVYVPTGNELSFAKGMDVNTAADDIFIVKGIIKIIDEEVDYYSGASYSIKTTPETGSPYVTYYYTTFDAAFAAIDSSDDKTVILMGGYAFDKSFTVKAGQTVSFEDAPYTISKDATITVEKDGTLSGGFVAANASANPAVAAGIQGVLVVMDGGNCKPTPKSYEVMSKDADNNYTYSGAGIAIENAQAGSTIYIVDTVKFTDKVTIPEGVTVDVAAGAVINASKGLNVNGTIKNAGTVNIGVDSDLIVAGTIENDGTVSFTAPAEGTTKGVATVTGKVIGNINGAKTINAAKYTDGIDTVYTSVSSAIAAVSQMEIPGDVEVTGKVSESSDVTLVDGMTLKIKGDVTLKSIRLVAGSVLDATDSKAILTADVIGTVGKVETTGATADAIVNLDGVNGANVKLTYSESTTTYTMTMKLAAYEGAVKVQQGSVSLASDNADLSFSEDATLGIASGATLTVSKDGIKFTDDATKKYLVNEGTLAVNNNMTFVNAVLGGEVVVKVEKTLTITGASAIVGTITLSEKTDKTPAKLVIGGTVEIGSTPETLGAAGSVSGDISFNGDNYAIVYNGSTFNDTTDVDSLKSTKYVVNGIEFATVYATGTVGITVLNVILYGLDDLDIDPIYQTGTTTIEGYDIDWYADGQKATGNVGSYEVLSADIDYESVNVKVSAAPGLTVYIDDLKTTGQESLAIGTHTITIYLDPNYEGTPVAKLNGNVINGTFQVTTDMMDGDNMIVVTGATYVEPSTPTPIIPTPTPSEKDDSMGITEYLLIVLVILAAILVVVVAIRMMRS